MTALYIWLVVSLMSPGAEIVSYPIGANYSALMGAGVAIPHEPSSTQAPALRHALCT